MNVFSIEPFPALGGKKERSEPRAGGDPHRFISDLQLSPSVSAAKKLPFNVVLSSSVLPCQDPNRKKQDRQSLHSTAWGPHDNSNPLTDCPYQPSAGQSTQPLQNHRLGPTPFPLVNIVTLNRTSSLITKPGVSMTIKMDCKACLCFTINNRLAAGSTQLLGGMARTLSPLSAALAYLVGCKT